MTARSSYAPPGVLLSVLALLAHAPTSAQCGGPAEFAVDPGFTTNAFGPAADTVGWLQAYDAGASSLISAVETAIGSASSGAPVPDGLPMRVVIIEDPTDDYDPTDGSLLWEFTTTTTNGATDILNSYAVTPPIAVSGVFYVGAAVDVNGWYTAPWYETTSAPVGSAIWLRNSISPIDFQNVGDNALVINLNGDPFGCFSCGLWRTRARTLCGPVHSAPEAGTVGQTVDVQGFGAPGHYYSIAASGSTGPTPFLGGILLDLGMDYTNNILTMGFLDGSGQSPVTAVPVPTTIPCGATGHSQMVTIESFGPITNVQKSPVLSTNFSCLP